MNLVKLVTVTMAVVLLSACATFDRNNNSESEDVNGNDVAIENRGVNSFWCGR